MNRLLADARFALRLLARSPGFTGTVVFILALGIGPNSAIFAALDQTVIRPLPYRDPDRLAMVWEDFSAFGVPKRRVSPRTFLDWRERTQAFAELAAYGSDTKNLSGSGAPEEVSGARVTANLLPLLGVHPLAGRTFSPDEEGPETRAVILGYRLWNHTFHGDRAIVGRSIVLNDEKYEVIGVMPSGFTYPDQSTEFWVPLGLSPQLLERRNSHFLKVLGRLKPGRDLRAAQSDMDQVAAQLASAFPNTNARVGVKVVVLKDEMVGDTRLALIVLVSAAACVLLIACANVANLLLARASNRRQEIAVRFALGAPPLRVLSELLMENLFLAAAGATAGLLLARWSIAALQRMVPKSLGGFVELHLDTRVLAFTAGAAIVATIVTGVAHTLPISRYALTGRSTIGGRHRHLRNVLVAGEVGVTLMLLVGAALLVQTLLRLRAVDPGFRSRNILTASVAVPLPKYADAGKRRRFYEAVLTRVHAIPGVTAAGLTSDLPYTSRGNTMFLAIENQPTAQAAARLGQDALFRLVSSGYLETIGAQLVQGRFLEDDDRAGTTPVVVVNETLARQYWPAESPLGHRINTGTGGGTPRWMAIVGVVRDIRERGLDLAMKPAVYVPLTQTDITFFQPSEMAVLTSREPLSMAKELQQAVWAVDAEQPVSNLRTMEAIVDDELAVRSHVLQLLGAFAAMALMLAALGIYAVVSFVVSQRTREIGLRMAIGARSEDIARGILGYSARVAGAGVVVGIAAGMVTTRLMSSLLFGVSPVDWRTFVGVAALLEAVAVVSSYVPMRRAAMVDPAIALRDE